jgi:hypothetical protein
VLPLHAVDQSQSDQCPFHHLAGIHTHFIAIARRLILPHGPLAVHRLDNRRLSNMRAHKQRKACNFHVSASSCALPLQCEQDVLVVADGTCTLNAQKVYLLLRACQLQQQASTPTRSDLQILNSVCGHVQISTACTWTQVAQPLRWDGNHRRTGL